MVTMPTFRKIIERFDLLYPNAIPFTDKVRFLFGFESSLFLSVYLMEKSDVAVENFADSAPVVEFPNDDIYIQALLVKYHVCRNDAENAGRAVAVLAEQIRAIKPKVEHQLFTDITDGG